MSVIKDPIGAIFALWQAKNHTGFKLINEHGAWGWSELLTHDMEKAEKFYTELFGWKAEKSPMGQTGYVSFKNVDRYSAGMMKILPEWGEMPSQWTVYFTVDNCDEFVKMAEQRGGKILVPPTDIEGVGRFSNLLDKEGAYFGVIEYKPQS